MKRHRRSDSLGFEPRRATSSPSPSLSHLLPEQENPKLAQPRRRLSTSDQIHIAIDEACRIASRDFSGGSRSSPSLKQFRSYSQLGSSPGHLSIAVAGDDEDTGPHRLPPRRPTGPANERLMHAAIESLRAENHRLTAENARLKLELEQLRDQLLEVVIAKEKR
jgi:hypothetical protein